MVSCLCANSLTINSSLFSGRRKLSFWAIGFRPRASGCSMWRPSFSSSPFDTTRAPALPPARQFLPSVSQGCGGLFAPPHQRAAGAWQDPSLVSTHGPGFQRHQGGLGCCCQVRASSGRLPHQRHGQRLQHPMSGLSCNSSAALVSNTSSKQSISTVPITRLQRSYRSALFNLNSATTGREVRVQSLTCNAGRLLSRTLVEPRNLRQAKLASQARRKY